MDPVIPNIKTLQRAPGGCLSKLGVLFLVLIAVVFLATVFGLGSVKDPYQEKAPIAVIEIEGTLFDSAYVGDLNEIAKNESVKVVILRVDSPGGAVAASEEIYEAVKRLKTKYAKVVLVSMSSVAASGAYFLAAPADRIFANRSTITGSIGVITEQINIQGLLENLNIKAQSITSGKFKDVGSPLRDMKPEERQYLQALLDNMHSQFKKAVMLGRKMTAEEVDAIADGRVFTGEQALKLKLVDAIGTLQDVIDYAALEYKLGKDPKVIYPNRKKATFLQLLTEEDAKSYLLNTLYSLKQSQFLFMMKGTR